MVKKLKQILCCVLIVALLAPDIACGMEFDFNGMKEEQPSIDLSHPRAKSLGSDSPQSRKRTNSLDHSQHFKYSNHQELYVEQSDGIGVHSPSIQENANSETDIDGSQTPDQWGQNSLSSIELGDVSVGEGQPLPPMVPDSFKKPSVAAINASPSTEASHLVLIRLKTPYEQKLEKLSEDERTTLRAIKRRALDLELTWLEISAVAFCVVISVLTTVGMWPIMSQGLIYLKERYHWNWIVDLEAGKASYALLVLTILSILPSTLGRNRTLLKKAVNSLAEKGIQTVRILRTGISTLLPSMIPPFYLIELERHDMAVTHTVGFNNQFAIAATILGPALLLDAWIANFDMEWEMETDLKEWVHSSDNVLSELLAYYFFPRQVPAEEEVRRQTFSKKLDGLIHALPKMGDTRRDEIYDYVLKARETIKLDISGLDQDNLDIAELLFVSRYLLACNEEAEGIKTGVNPWPFILGTAGLALFMGTMVLQFMGDVILQFTGAVFPQLGISRQFCSDMGWVFAIFGLYTLAGFMVMGMKNFFKNFVPHESRIEQGLAMIAGAIYTIPFAIVSLQVCNKWWKDATWMITAIPLLLAKFLTLSAFFCSAYHNAGTSLVKFNNLVVRKKFGYNFSASYKTNYILERIEGIKNRLPYFSDSMLKWLEKGLEVGD